MQKRAFSAVKTHRSAAQYMCSPVDGAGPNSRQDVHWSLALTLDYMLQCLTSVDMPCTCQACLTKSLLQPAGAGTVFKGEAHIFTAPCTFVWQMMTKVMCRGPRGRLTRASRSPRAQTQPPRRRRTTGRCMWGRWTTARRLRSCRCTSRTAAPSTASPSSPTRWATPRCYINNPFLNMIPCSTLWSIFNGLGVIVYHVQSLASMSCQRAAA